MSYRAADFRKINKRICTPIWNVRVVMSYDCAVDNIYDAHMRACVCVRVPVSIQTVVTLDAMTVLDC